MPIAERWVLIPDSHHPFVDRKAWNLLKKVIRLWKPHGLVTLGDLFDFYSVSSHTKDPQKKLLLIDEIDACRRVLDELHNCGVSQSIFIAGNHEDRLDRYLQSTAPALSGLIDFPSLMRFEEMGWDYVPYKQYTRIGKLYLTHDNGVAGARAHEQAEADFQSSCVIGHTHRLSYTVKGNCRGERHQAVMLGWLGDPAQAGYMYKVKTQRDWAHGFGLAYKAENGEVWIVPVPIINGKCLIEGELVW